MHPYILFSRTNLLSIQEKKTHVLPFVQFLYYNFLREHEIHKEALKHMRRNAKKKIKNVVNHFINITLNFDSSIMTYNEMEYLCSCPYFTVRL